MIDLVGMVRLRGMEAALSPLRGPYCVTVRVDWYDDRFVGIVHLTLCPVVGRISDCSVLCFRASLFQMVLMIEPL